MTELLLLTGFLGAGKTTLLKRLVSLHSRKRLAIIINEFGREGMDARLLGALQAEVREIAGGSVFCNCRLDQFEAALAGVCQAAPQLVLVEASGLSNPGNIEKILQQPTFSSIRYKGSLCLVDATSFEKVLATVPVCKKQLEASHTVLVNKADLVPPARLDAVCGAVRGAAPWATVHTTSFAQLQPQWLDEMRPPAAGDAARLQTRDLGLIEKRVQFRDITLYQLQKFLEMVAEDSHRIKGFVQCREGMQTVDCVGSHIALQPYGGDTAGLPQGISVMAGPGLPMEKSLARAAEWYAPQIASVQ